MGKGSRNRQNRAEAKQAATDRDMRRVVLRELNTELSSATDRFFQDETSVILWVLHTTFGFGAERLRRFYDGYKPANDKLKEYYAMSDSDMPYMTKRLLKDIGVDLDEWERD